VVIIQAFNSANPSAGSTGTGFFISDDKIVTDAHVVNGNYDRILVTSLSGQQIYVEPNAFYNNGIADIDLAIFKVQNAATHAHLEFADSLPQEGETVTVIGNPQGMTGTVSTGIVSAVRKNGEIIQFTAPISNGSSGDPVLDDDGKVIGIADFILTPRNSEIAQTLNFAHGVPVIRTALNYQPSPGLNEGDIVSAQEFKPDPIVAPTPMPPPKTIWTQEEQDAYFGSKPEPTPVKHPRRHSRNSLILQNV
jgi:serine protease Do